MRLEYIGYPVPALAAELMNEGSYEAAGRLLEYELACNLLRAHNCCCKYPLDDPYSVYVSAEFAIDEKPGFEDFMAAVGWLAMTTPDPEYLNGDLRRYCEIMLEKTQDLRALFESCPEL